MQKQTLRLRKRSASRFLFPLASTGLVLLFLFVIFPLVPEIKLASATIDNTVYGLELATNPSINLSIQPTSNGTISVAKDTVTANTNSPSGYKLYLSVNKDLDNNIYLNGDINNNTTNTKFIPTTGTFETPSALDQNSWGYAVAGLNAFDATYANPTATSKFANLPTANNEQLIHDHTGVATDDATDIYYGVKADINIASGSYSTELLYTTLSDASSEVNGEAEITPSQVDNGYVATELTIATSLVASRNLGTISAMIGSVACEGVELVTNNPVTITCTLPAGLVGGKYNVALNIPNLGKSYTIENGFEVSPQVTANVASSSTGYGTISNNGFIAPYGTPITTNGNTIIIGDQTITATPAAQTAQYTYVFASWTNNCGATVTGNCTISANFTRTTRSYTVTFAVNASGYGTTSRSSQTVTYGGAVSVSGATATVAGTATTATPTAQTAQYDYAFANWTNNCGATVTGNCTITANFTRTLRSYDVTVDFAGTGVSKVEFVASGYDTRTVTLSGAKASLVYGVQYTMTMSFTSGYEFSSWSTSAGTLSSTSANPAKLTITSTATVTATGKASCFSSDNLNNITTMQQMTSKISTCTPENTSKQLIDTRDNKLYWVTKLKDGNIWMTQNLDYDIVAGDNIISNNDGTTSIWNTSSTYAPRATTTSVFKSKNYTDTYSYDPGSNYIPNGTGTPTAITCTSTSNGGENCHYHQGNYYQHNAATAGTGGTTTIRIATDAPSSICPKGWRLPTSDSDSASYSFGNLVKQYGYTGTRQDNTTDATLLASPLFFARGGYVQFDQLNLRGSLDYQGRYGCYWSSKGYSSINSAYYLYFDSSYVIPSNYGSRYYGQSVRCVAL